MTTLTIDCPDSSLLLTLAYGPEVKRVIATYRDGSQWQYDDVIMDEWLAIGVVKSKGSMFCALVRDRPARHAATQLRARKVSA